MRLIGMLDSPYVRRVAVSLRLMELPFIHEPVSVFRDFDHFASLNPVVKAPSLIIDHGTVLMESTLILDYLDRLAAPELRLTPTDLDQYRRAQRVIGVALAACEKAVQILYEVNLRPQEKRHEPWLARVGGQLGAALTLLDAEIPADGAWLFCDRPMQADITAAVAFHFTRAVESFIPGVPGPSSGLAALSERAEAMAAFADYRLDGASVSSD